MRSAKISVGTCGYAHKTMCTIISNIYYNITGVPTMGYVNIDPYHNDDFYLHKLINRDITKSYIELSYWIDAIWRKSYM